MEELMAPTSPLNQQESNLTNSTEPDIRKLTPEEEKELNPVHSSPAPEEMTEEKFRKLPRKVQGQLRRSWFTVVHGTVRACGHKAAFSKDHDPRNNCASCWSAFFATAVDLEFVHAVLTTKGVKELVKLRGKKFAKMLHGFLATQILPALNAEIKPQ